MQIAFSFLWTKEQFVTRISFDEELLYTTKEI